MFTPSCIVCGKPVLGSEYDIFTDGSVHKNCNPKLTEQNRGRMETRVVPTGVPDFIGDSDVCTVSEIGTGKMIDCLKCPKCGYSVTK